MITARAQYTVELFWEANARYKVNKWLFWGLRLFGLFCFGAILKNKIIYGQVSEFAQNRAIIGFTSLFVAPLCLKWFTLLLFRFNKYRNCEICWGFTDSIFSVLTGENKLEFTWPKVSYTKWYDDGVAIGASWIPFTAFDNSNDIETLRTYIERSTHPKIIGQLTYKQQYLKRKKKILRTGQIIMAAAFVIFVFSPKEPLSLLIVFSGFLIMFTALLVHKTQNKCPHCHGRIKENAQFNILQASLFFYCPLCGISLIGDEPAYNMNQLSIDQQQKFKDSIKKLNRISRTIFYTFSLLMISVLIACIISPEIIRNKVTLLIMMLSFMGLIISIMLPPSFMSPRCSACKNPLLFFSTFFGEFYKGSKFCNACGIDLRPQHHVENKEPKIKNLNKEPVPTRNTDK